MFLSLLTHRFEDLITKTGQLGEMHKLLSRQSFNMCGMFRQDQIETDTETITILAIIPVIREGIGKFEIDNREVREVNFSFLLI